jgi:hypothetical protein
MGELLREAGEGIARMAGSRIPVAGDAMGIIGKAIFNRIAAAVESGHKSLDEILAAIPAVPSDIDDSEWVKRADEERAREHPEKA